MLRIELWGQIWNPLIIQDILGPICYELHILIFYFPRIKNKNKSSSPSFFFEIDIFRSDLESTPQNTAYKPIYEIDFEKTPKTGPPYWLTLHQGGAGQRLSSSSASPASSYHHWNWT